MIKALMRRKIFSRKSFITCTAILLSSSTTSGQAAPLHESHETRGEQFADAMQVFESYKKLDLASDAKLIEHYAPNATIEAGVERERGDIRWQKLDRDGLAREMAASFKDEHLNALKSEESYGHPKFKRMTKDGKPTIEVIFHGKSGHAGIKVTWYLRADQSNRWLIVLERSVTYSKKSSTWADAEKSQPALH